MSAHHEVVIIGSGPAGLTAAIYTARADLAPLVIEGEPSSTSDQPGGQLMLTTEVENFPGFPQGVMGPQLMSDMREQAARFGANFLTDRVSRVDFSQRPFSVWVGDSDGEPTYLAESVIVSTGARSIMLGLEAETRLMGHGLSTCATCDGFFFRDKKVLVVGGGDSAMEEATFLTKFASEVVLIHRRDEFRASKIMIDRAMVNSKISVEYNSNVDDIIGTKETGVTAVRLKDTISGAKRDVVCDGIFMAIGHKPNTKLFSGSIDLDNAGYIITNSDTTYTNLEGVFACGDVQDHVYRQAVTAAGTGCMAAIDAERWLEQETE